MKLTAINDHLKKTGKDKDWQTTLQWWEKETLLLRSTAQKKNKLPFFREPMWSNWNSEND